MSLGPLGEKLARQYYEGQGYKLLEQNYIFRRGKQSGEIDLIVTRNKELVFVEVKTRRSQKFGSGMDAVDFFKQSKLVRTVKLFLQEHKQYQGFNYRIDVAAVDIDNTKEPVIIIPNAIEDLD